MVKEEKHVIAFNDNNQDGVYKAPRKKGSARGGGWFYAKITDMSDTYRDNGQLQGQLEKPARDCPLTFAASATHWHTRLSQSASEVCQSFLRPCFFIRSYNVGLLTPSSSAAFRILSE